MLNFDLTDTVAKVLTSILVFLLTAYTPVIMRYIHQKASEVKVSVGERRYDQIVSIVTQAVVAAEQTGLIGDIKKTGAEKKEAAIRFAQAELDAQGIKVDLTRLDGLIEAAVFTQDF